MKSLILTACFALFLSLGTAQQKDYSTDVASAETITAALYNAISGEPGQARDWDRFRNLFKPEGRMIPTRKGDAGELTLKALSTEEYIQLFSSRIKSGFYERELHRVQDSYGTVTHVFSTYETK